ncbi:response regulator transcription factor [Microbacterium sp. SORGH_AS_0888]|uniref:response regulator transcription factor n=1 Tax=Microbacterium sp. SORGH_AS_0888 TaxID=3041791 RepID=UPI0027D810D8|nr:response regulator transcription factor [Microbacterium sp. SORGH_AS_0888]
MDIRDASTASRGAGGMIAVVEDDRTVRTVVVDYLRGRGYDVRDFADGATARQALASFAPDLVILDRMLPGMPGDELLRDIRRRSDIPVIMLTALGSAGDRVDGLERGADDYLAKPFALRELELRVETHLRRGRTAQSPLTPFAVGPFRIDPAVRRITRDGREIVLSGREYELLLFFLKNPGRVVARDEILRDVWGWSSGDASTVTVHVRRLREKIERDPALPEFLLTEWGRGYLFRVGGTAP